MSVPKTWSGPNDRAMAPSNRKRSIRIAKHRTSISLEDPFWDALQGFAKQDCRSTADLIAEIDTHRHEGLAPADRADAPGGRPRRGGLLNLSAAIRLYVLQRLQKGA